MQATNGLHIFILPFMGLEQEIKQQAFRNDFQKATINLLFTHNWLETKLSEFFRQYDLTMRQYNVLRILKGQYPQPISTAGLRDRMLDKMSDTSRIVDRLYKKGLLQRRTCKRDKRLVDIVLSDQGLELLKQLEGSVGHLDNFLRKLSPDEASQLNYLLDKIRDQ